MLASVKEDLLVRLEDSVNLTILERLPEEHISELTDLFEAGKMEEAQQLIAQHVPEVESLVASALLNFRQSYLG